jgi:hypothetical protein
LPLPTVFAQVVFQAKIIGKHFKVDCACMLATMPLFDDAQLVLFPGCKLSSAPVDANGACTVVDIRKDDTSASMPALRSVKPVLRSHARSRFRVQLRTQW